jgi:hypothetical protein
MLVPTASAMGIRVDTNDGVVKLSGKQPYAGAIADFAPSLLG